MARVITIHKPSNIRGHRMKRLGGILPSCLPPYFPGYLILHSMPHMMAWPSPRTTRNLLCTSRGSAVSLPVSCPGASALTCVSWRFSR